MANYKTGLIITGDASGGIKAVRATESELGKLNKGFDRGTKRSREYANQSNQTSTALKFLRTNLLPLSTLVTGLFSAGSIRTQIDFADQLQKTNLRIGAGTAALSEYNYVAELSGIQFNTLTTAWQRQTRRISEASLGTGEAVKALKELNLNAKELATLSPEDQFERIARAIEQVESPGRKAALAMRLWDTEGVALLQMINQGTGAIAQLRHEAQRFGLTITQQTADQMAEFNDQLTKLRFAATGLSRTMMADLVPSISESLSSMNQMIIDAGGMAEVLGTAKTAAEFLAIVVAGRLTQAFYLATAAKLSSIQSMRVYRTVTAAGLTVVNQMSVAQLALAASTTAANRALFLAGGPMGAAILAGAAIYTFREELGLVDPVAKSTAESLKQFESAIKSSDKAAIDSNFDSLTEDLIAVSLRAQEASLRMQELEARERFYSRSHKGVSDSARGALDNERAALENYQRQINELTDALGQLESRRSSLNSGAGSSAVSFGSAPDAAADRLRNSAADYLVELHRLNSTEQQQILHWRSDSLVRIRDFHRQQVLSAQEASWAEIAIEEEAARRLNEIREKQQSDAVNFMAGIRGYSDGGQTQNDLWYQDQLDELRDFHQESLISEREFNEASYLLSQEWADRRTEIQEKLREDNMSASEKFIEQIREDAENFDKIWADTFNSFASGFASTVADTILEADNLQQGIGNLLQGFARSMIQTFAEIAIKRMALWVMEKTIAQSGAASFSASIAGQAGTQAVMAALNAYTATAAIPIFGPSLASSAALTAGTEAGALAAAATASASISTLSGMAHEGIDNIPKTGTWLLDKGERVVDRRTNADLKTFLDRHESRSGGSLTKPPVSITIPIHVQAQSGMSEQQARNQGRVMADQIEMQILGVMQEQMRPGGLLSRD